VHEEMITSSDAFTTYDLGDTYVILPQVPAWSLEDFINKFNAQKVPAGFNYSSGQNTQWVNAEELRELIIKHIDKDFIA
jgi:FlaA1/EpsC-like NDP-sugar epimerase